MTPNELNGLIDELLDGLISEVDFLRLEAELHVTARARQAYYERLKLHTALQIEAEGLARLDREAGEPSVSPDPL